jgi:hypothetical protein
MQLNQLSGHPSRNHNLSEKLQTSFLLVVVVIGLVIALASVYSPIFDFLVKIFPFLAALNLTALLLLVFSTLGIAISLERYEAFGKAKNETQRRHEEVIHAIYQVQKIFEDDLTRELTEVHQTLATAIDSKPLIGNEAVYGEAIRLIKACKGSEVIRATSLINNLHDESKTPYKEYIQTLAKAVGQSKQKRLNMVYKVVMGLQSNDKGEPQLAYQQTINRRREVFKENDALDRLEIKCLETYWSLNMLIVGNEQMIIGFPTIAGDSSIRSGIRVTNKDFVDSVARWFDEYLWHRAEYVIWTDDK